MSDEPLRYSPGLPPGQYPLSQFPPYQGPPQPQQVWRRGGCRGCLMGCLVACLVGLVVIVIAVAAGASMLRQMYPTAESAQEAAGCVVMRIFVNNLERLLAASDLTEAEKEGMRREFQQQRQAFEDRCGPLQ